MGFATEDWRLTAPVIPADIAALALAMQTAPGGERDREAVARKIVGRATEAFAARRRGEKSAWGGGTIRAAARVIAPRTYGATIGACDLWALRDACAILAEVEKREARRRRAVAA